MSATLIKPVAVTGAMLVSTTATEPAAAWSALTTYAADVLVQHNNRLWKSAAGSNLAHEPGVALTWWVDQGPTNVWAMFDNQISTKTRRAGSLEVVVACGAVNAVGLAGLEGDTVRLRLRDGSGGSLVREWTLSLDGTVIADWYQYYFEPAAALTQLVVLDVPPYLNGHLEVLVTAASGDAAVGVLSVGAQYSLGDAMLGAQAQLVDFSRKVTDSASGVVVLEPGRWSRRLSVRTTLPRGQIHKTDRVVADVRGMACFWVMSGDQQDVPLTVFGFANDFSVAVEYATECLCTFDLEGMTV